VHFAIFEKVSIVLPFESDSTVTQGSGPHRRNVKKEEERNVVVETYPLLYDCVLLRNDNYTGRDNISLVYRCHSSQGPLCYIQSLANMSPDPSSFSRKDQRRSIKQAWRVVNRWKQWDEVID